jgi:hypothetical protein
VGLPRYNSSLAVAELWQMQKKARAPKKAAEPLDSEEEELKKLKVRLG